MITSLDFVQSLTGYKNRLTSVELYVDDEKNYDTVKEQVLNLLGDEYEILTSEEQHSDLLRAVKIEKLFVYVALSLSLPLPHSISFFASQCWQLKREKIFQFY